MLGVNWFRFEVTLAPLIEINIISKSLVEEVVSQSHLDVHYHLHCLLIATEGHSSVLPACSPVTSVNRSFVKKNVLEIAYNYCVSYCITGSLI